MAAESGRSEHRNVDTKIPARAIARMSSLSQRSLRAQDRFRGAQPNPTHRPQRPPKPKITPPKPLDSPGHSDQRATVVLFEAYEVLLHHFDLLGQFKERLENFALSRRRIQSRHQRMKASHGIAQLIASSPHLSYRLGSFHALNGT